MNEGQSIRGLNSSSHSRGRRPSPNTLENPTPPKTRAQRNGHTAKPAGSSEPGDSIYTIYLREIGEFPLISYEEEVALAARVRRGDEKARERMVTANLRLVVKIARDFEGYGLPLLDLINEGNLGLMKAVDRYDPSKGAKLSSYAAWWIRQGIKRALANQARTIRLPVHLVDRLARIRRVKMEFQEVWGREPDPAEIAKQMRLPVAKIAHLLTMSSEPQSLDAPTHGDDTETLEEFVADEQAQDPARHISHEGMLTMLEEAMKQLTPREARILAGRFGLDGQSEETLELLGQEFGLTRECIRQIQNNTLKKLRRWMEIADGLNPALRNGKSRH